MISIKQGKAAVIIRTKNRELFLKRALNSVVSQTFDDWHIIIVNDGGDKDKVKEVIENSYGSYTNQIEIIHNETSLGPQGAANAGMKAAKSKYAVMHDDDDTWQPLFLEKCIGFLDNNKDRNIKGVVTHCKRIQEEVKENEINILQEAFINSPKRVAINKMANIIQFIPITFVFERAVFDEIGYFNDSIPILEDWEFYMRFVEKYDIAVIPESLANYHSRKGSTDSVIKNRNKLELYDNYIRNALLRKDIERGTAGMGFLACMEEREAVINIKLNKIAQMCVKK